MNDDARTSFADRLRAAQELNALSKVRPASAEFRRLVRDVERWERSAAPTGWSRELRVRALVGEASCTYALRGSIDAGELVLDQAQSVASESDDPQLSVLVHGQRGLLLLRSGAEASALRELTVALDGADVANHRDMTLLRLNRGSALLDLGLVDAAMADYQDAFEHARALGNQYYEAFALHNIGYAHHLLGDMPEALRRMEESVALLPDGPDGMALLGRARVLYDVGLLGEAERTLDEAEALLGDEGLTMERAEALLDRARCLVGLRRFDEARHAAVGARRLYRQAGNETWCLYARVVELEAWLGSDRPPGTDTSDPTARRRARRRSEIALKVAQAGDDRGAVGRFGVSVPARLYAAEWSLLGGDVELAQEILTAIPRVPGWVSFPVRVQHHAVRARIAFERGDRRGGVRAVRRGQAAISDHRARLGSVDAVTATAVHGAHLGIIDVEAALRSGRPAAVLDAVERGRATFAGTGRVRPPEDREHAALLVRARQEIEAARGIGTTTEADEQEPRQRHLREARRLQEQARSRAWRHSGDAEVPVPTTERTLRRALAEAESEAVVADLLIVGDRILGVRVDRRGSRQLQLASTAEVAERARRARADFAVLSNALIPVPMREAAHASLRRALTWLDESLVAPLEAPAGLHVAARDMLLGLPWASLPSRHGLRTWTNSWIDLRPGDPQRRADDALVVAGPGLHFSTAEAQLVAKAWGSVELLAGDDATCASVVAGLDGVGVVHLAAHGRHEPDNPLFSSVRLADGPLFAHELDGTDLVGVVVVLSACEVGLSSPRTGGESLGLAAVLLRLGARAVIASVAPLRDDVAARVMPSLHAELRAGSMPGTALARAVADEPEPVPLVCFGPLVL